MSHSEKIFYSLVIATAIFLFLPKEVSATPPILISPPTTMTINQEYVIEATMSGLSKNATYRLRLTLSKSGTSNYFGSTWSESQWYNGTPSPIDYTKFLSINTNNDGTWSGQAKGKIESNDPNYKEGAGDYVLKLGRYTESGTTAVWSEQATISLVDLSPTPTPTPTPTHPATDTPPTPTPKPPSPTPKPTPKPTPTKMPTATPDESLVLSASSVSELTMMPSPTPPESTPQVLGESTSKPNNFLPFVFIGLGAVLVVTSGAFLLMPKFKRYNKTYESGETH